MLPLLTWLVQGAVGPALVGLPVTWTATKLAGAAKQWFRRLRRSDGLSQIVRAAGGGDIGLSDAEFAAIRRLLEQQSTWELVGDGTVEDVAARIASCLPDRADAASLAAGRAIAAGLLEFAVRDLEPEWFQRVLFARIDRLENRQASALDEAMLSVHADLAALLAHQEADDVRFSRVMGQLGRVLDRLPPGPADRREVTVYLVTLIRWLNTDPWPDDTSFRGPVLTPASIERKLRIATGRAPAVRDLDADGLAGLCIRLVVLGAPGSGKTWLAKRTVRLCAGAALDALKAGAGLDGVELPLYTTCARLAAAPTGDGIRRAIVASALSQLPDVGGSRVLDALRVLFEERDAPTLLVADSLDEARGADDRVRQADTLPAAWRIVLTSRPGSWNRQLSVRHDDPSRRVGLLQPLRYPDDVEPLIAAWFSGRPAQGNVLAGQIRDRPALQQAATVPLLLAFYCIIGGDRPLPARHAELYERVIKRMLTGRWRGSGDRDPEWDPKACLKTLRGWAWSAAASHPVSGVGNWVDEFAAPRVKSRDDRDALDHVAVRLGWPDLDTDMTWRRFVHRSIHEHLVAEHVALRMPPGKAAAELVNHLWYDPDWEYAAPAALAMHPQREQVLKELICRVTGSDQLTADLTAIDGCWEIRRFLARVARESSEGDWSPEVAELIGQARTDLVTSRRGNLYLVMADDWPTSNGLIIEWLLNRLAHETGGWDIRMLAEAVTRLAVTPHGRASARQALVARLARETSREIALVLADAVARLDPVPQDLALAREALLARLSETSLGTALELADAVARLDPVPQDLALAREALLAELSPITSPGRAWSLARVVIRLTVTSQDRASVREALLARITRRTSPETARVLARVVARLTVTSQDRASVREALLARITRKTSPETALRLAEAVAGLDPAPQDLALAREALLARLSPKTSPGIALELAEAVARLDPESQDVASARAALLVRLARETSPKAAWSLARAVTRLAVTPQDQASTRQGLLALLARKTSAGRTWALAEAVTRLAVTPQDRVAAREALLTLLTEQTHRRTAGALAEAVTRLAVTPQDRVAAREALLTLLVRETSPKAARALAGAVAGLDPAPQDLAAARAALLALLADETIPGAARALAGAVAGLDPAPQDLAAARAALLALLADETIPGAARALAGAVAELDPAPHDLASVRQALLARLTRQASPETALRLARAVATLDPAPHDLASVRQALLARLTRQASPETALRLARAVATLDPAPHDLASVRQALLARLTRQASPETALRLARAVATLDPAPHDLASVRQALLAQLTPQTSPLDARALAKEVIRFAVTPQDLASARQALLALLTRNTSRETARELAYAVAELSVTAADLGGSGTWPFPPTTALLTAARRKSELPAWLAVLPQLST